MLSVTNVDRSTATEIREGSILPTRAKLCLSGYSEELRCPEMWRQPWTLWIFSQSKISSGTLVSHLKPSGCFCTKNKGGSLCLDEGWKASQTRWHMSQVLKGAQEPSGRQIFLPGTESIMVNNIGDMKKHARDTEYETGGLVCLCVPSNLEHQPPINDTLSQRLTRADLACRRSCKRH